jgi:cytidylate kinase
MSDYFGAHDLFLTKTSFNSDLNEKINLLIAKLQRNPKTIVSIFGLAGVGKGTLSDLLAKNLSIPNLDTGKIWRAITYIYTTLNLEINTESTDLVLKNLQINVKNSQLEFCFNDKILTHTDLKNGLIDSKVSIIARDGYTHQRFFGKCLEVYQNIGMAFVRDGRGASPKDLRLAEENSFKIIRILLDCSDKVKWERYYHNIFLNKRGNNLNLENSPEFESKLRQEFEINIIARNNRDIINQQELGNGLITPQTGVINSDNLTPDDVLKLAIDFIDQNL